MGTEDYFDRATGSFNPPFLCIITYNRLSFYTLKNEDPATEVLCNVYTVVVVSGVSQTDGRWSIDKDSIDSVTKTQKQRQMSLAVCPVVLSS